MEKLISKEITQFSNLYKHQDKLFDKKGCLIDDKNQLYEHLKILFHIDSMNSNMRVSDIWLSKNLSSYIEMYTIKTDKTISILQS